MPAFRSKYRCAGYAEEAAAKNIKKPKAPKKILTEEEKEEAEIQKELRTILNANKKAWEATLVPWVANDDFRIPTGTIALYKSDAKSAYGLTEKEILTLRYESIPGSPKTFFIYEDVLDLYDRKEEAGAYKVDMKPKEQITTRAFEKIEETTRRSRKNFRELPSYWQLLRNLKLAKSTA